MNNDQIFAMIVVCYFLGMFSSIHHNNTVQDKLDKIQEHLGIEEKQ